MAENEAVGFKGRRSPYTAIGISRVPCARCGQPSVHQWQICSNGNRYLGCCADCDVALNRLALDFMRVPNADELLRRYREKATAQLFKRGNPNQGVIIRDVQATIDPHPQRPPAATGENPR